MVYLLILVIILIWIIVTYLIPILTFPRISKIENNPKTSIPKELKKEILKLKKITDKKKCILAALKYIKRNFKSTYFLLFIQLHKHYYSNLSNIIKKKGFWPCHIQLFILKVLIIKSGKFKDKDIQTHYSIYNGVIHEYLKIKLNNNWIDVDPWGYNRGIPLGYHSMGPLVNWLRFKITKQKITKAEEHLSVF